MPDYGPAHRRLRAWLLAAYIPGVTTCWRCEQPITTLRRRDIHLGHDDDNPAIWRGLEHAACNLSAGAANGNKQRPPQAISPWRRRSRSRHSRVW
jgi:hypothetical protein